MDTWGEFGRVFLVIILIIMAFGILTHTLIGIGDKNRQKTENMTRMCVEQGYEAWIDSEAGYSVCIGSQR